MADSAFRDTVADMAEEFNTAVEAAKRVAANFKPQSTKNESPESADPSQPSVSKVKGDETVADVAKGEICEVKELYESQKSTCSCCKQ